MALSFTSGGNSLPSAFLPTQRKCHTRHDRRYSAAVPSSSRTTQKADPRLRARVDLVGGWASAAACGGAPARHGQTLAGCILERRDLERAVHLVPAMLLFRIFAIAYGGTCPRVGEAGPGEGCRQRDDLHGDPLFKLAVGWARQSGRHLCSQPTMNRLDNAPSRIDVGRLKATLVDVFCHTFGSRAPAL